MGDQTTSSTKSLLVITGPPGSGKTPIVRELVASGFTGVAEPAREVIAEQRAIGGDGVYDKNPRLFFNLMLSRAVADFRRMRGAPGLVFFDRGIPDLIGYAELFGLEASDAATAAAVHQDLDARTLECGYDGVQHFERRAHLVELPAAVIRDHQRFGAARDGALGIFDAMHAFDDERAVPRVPNPGDIVPRHRRGL